MLAAGHGGFGCGEQSLTGTRAILPFYPTIAGFRNFKKYETKTMKNTAKVLLIVAIVLIFTSRCTSVQRTMREPSVRVELERDDFELSDQVSAEARSVRILGIDWTRLINKNLGTIEGGSIAVVLANLPVIGNAIGDPTANYALYQLMVNNPGYDVIFYPQYVTTVERPILGVGFFKKITTVKTTARLGKLK